MISLDFITQNFSIPIQDPPLFITEWWGFGVSVVKNHPQASFATANLLLFIVMNAIAEELDARVQESGQSFEGSNKLFEEILIDYVLFGIAFLTFNLSIEKMTSYSLGMVVRLAITITAIAMRTFIRSISE